MKLRDLLSVVDCEIRVGLYDITNYPEKRFIEQLHVDDLYEFAEDEGYLNWEIDYISKGSWFEIPVMNVYIKHK